MLRTRSVHSPIDRRNDGLRILATRVRGRGMRKTRYDVWMANLGPSERLKNSGIADTSWQEFKRQYEREIYGIGTAAQGNKTIRNHGQKFTLRLIKRLAQKQTGTLMCHCEEAQKNCHRFLLKDLIKRA